MDYERISNYMNNLEKWELETIVDDTDGMRIIISSLKKGQYIDIYFEKNVYAYKLAIQQPASRSRSSIEIIEKSEYIEEVKRRCYEVWDFEDMFHLRIKLHGVWIDAINDEIPVIKIGKKK